MVWYWFITKIWGYFLKKSAQQRGFQYDLLVGHTEDTPSLVFGPHVAGPQKVRRDLSLSGRTLVSRPSW